MSQAAMNLVVKNCIDLTGENNEQVAHEVINLVDDDDDDGDDDTVVDEVINLVDDGDDDTVVYEVIDLAEEIADGDANDEHVQEVAIKKNLGKRKHSKTHIPVSDRRLRSRRRLCVKKRLAKM